jgi:hypothetical protein
VARGVAPSYGGGLGPMCREGKGVSRAVHSGRCEENRGINGKVTTADRRSTPWTECKARRGSFHKRDTGSGWDGTGWWLALAHARQRERARVGRVQGGWAVEAGSRGGNTHAICSVAAGGDEVDE